MKRLHWALKNTAGRHDSMFTFASVGFIVTTIAVLTSLIQDMSIGNFHLTFKSPDSSLVLGYLSATFTAYVVRRNKTDDMQKVAITTEQSTTEETTTTVQNT